MRTALVVVSALGLAAAVPLAVTAVPSPARTEAAAEAAGDDREEDSGPLTDVPAVGREKKEKDNLDDLG